MGNMAQTWLQGRHHALWWRGVWKGAEHVGMAISVVSMSMSKEVVGLHAGSVTRRMG